MKEFIAGDLVMFEGEHASTIFECDGVLPSIGRILARAGTTFYSSGIVKGDYSTLSTNFPLDKCRKVTDEETDWYDHLYTI